MRIFRMPAIASRDPESLGGGRREGKSGSARTSLQKWAPARFGRRQRAVLISAWVYLVLRTVKLSYLITLQRICDF